MDKNQFDALSKKLDTIIALLAIDKEKLAEKSKTEAILYLNELGLDNTTIALATESTSGAVAVRISEAKKAKGSKKAIKAMATKDTPMENVDEVVEVTES